MVQYLNQLTKGQQVKVIKTFLDFDKTQIETGTILTFVNYTYFPYDGGFTFTFEEGIIRLAEIDANSEHVMNNFHEFFALVDTSSSQEKST
ncbi:MAG: DUF3601 domain-containing protein [Cyclobacteriaceae bacterium]|nr:DUF3601 domain-containing protein [Cyclobacteriaceae bacterium]